METNELVVMKPKNKNYKRRMKMMSISIEPDIFERFNRIAKKHNINKSRTIAHLLNDLCDKIEIDNKE